MIPTAYPDRATMARLSARMLLDIGAVHFNTDQLYTHASGKQAPTYIDCRKIISYPRVRATLMDFLCCTVMEAAGLEAFDNIAGGETAGIPFAALVAERMALPMSYVRKKPKGYGRAAQIEGEMPEGARALLVEDLTTDGGSKIAFVEVLRKAGATCAHTAVVFFYDIYPDTQDKLGDHGLRLHWLTTWADVLDEAARGGDFDADTLGQVRQFLDDPAGWRAARGFS